MSMKLTSVCWCLVPALMIAACSTSKWDNTSGAAQIDESSAAVDLPRSKQGNPPFYEVYGKRYTVMKTSGGYKERGVASWYGKKFHGRSTSSGERYDMYAMTAAHKTLPLPTNVRVTNLETGKSIIVRVNDRGPFVKDRIIDLSYVAAQELDVVTNGTALVEVVALGATSSTSAAVQPKAITKEDFRSSPGDVEMYLQVGAFGERRNAQKLADKLSSNGIIDVHVHAPKVGAPALYRVRIGPVYSISDYDRLAQQVERLQIAETHLVVESSSGNSAKRADTSVSGG